MKGPIAIDFLEKGAPVNSTFFCQLLRQNSPYLMNDSPLCVCVCVCVCVRERERERGREREKR